MVQAQFYHNLGMGVFCLLKNIFIMLIFYVQFVKMHFCSFFKSDGLPALVTLKKGLVALARQWMKFIVVTPAFKGVSLHRPAQPVKLQTNACHENEDGLGLDNGGGLQSDTSADGAEFEFDAGISVFLPSKSSQA